MANWKEQDWNSDEWDIWTLTEQKCTHVHKHRNTHTNNTYNTIYHSLKLGIFTSKYFWCRKCRMGNRKRRLFIFLLDPIDLENWRLTVMNICSFSYWGYVLICWYWYMHTCIYFSSSVLICQTNIPTFCIIYVLSIL